MEKYSVQKDDNQTQQKKKYGKITVTLDKSSGEQEVNIENIDPVVMAQVFGNILKQVSEDKYQLGTKPKDQYLLESVAVICENSGVKIDTKSGWNDARITEPRGSIGPFMCFDANKHAVYMDMYYDSDARMFGDKQNRGYPDITHWIPMPR